jgi:hypothetical protein
LEVEESGDAKEAPSQLESMAEEACEEAAETDGLKAEALKLEKAPTESPSSTVMNGKDLSPTKANVGLPSFNS